MRTLFTQKMNNKWQKVVHSDVRQSITKKILATVLAIAVAFAISIIIACSVCHTWGRFGQVIQTIFVSGFKKQYHNTLFSNMGILIVGGLAFIFAYKAGLFNIGISGQMVAGGTAATLMCHLAKITPGLNQVLIVLVSMGIGALVAAIIGALKAYLRVNEVVSSIMFNWIIYFMSILILSSITTIPHDAANMFTDAPADNLLLRIGGNSWIPLIIISAILVVLVAIILNFTVFGRKQKVTGLSNTGALAAGYKVKANMIASMAISGAISGILGVMVYCGFSPYMPINAASKVIPPEGFNGISVGLISMCSPFASIPISLFFSMIKTSVSELQIIGVDNHIADVVYGVVVYGAAAIALFLNLKPYWLTLEVFKGKNYSKIRHERNMTNIELLSLSSDQCAILKKYYVYYQKSANPKSTLKLSPFIRLKMWLANIRYKQVEKKAQRNVKRNTTTDLYSYKPYFKQEMAHIIKHNGVLVVDKDHSKHGGWYIKVNDQVLHSPTLKQKIEEETGTRCNAELVRQLHKVNDAFKAKPFNDKQIRLIPLLAYLQNVRTGLKYRDQISKENKLAYFTFQQTKMQAESIGLDEIQSRRQYKFAHTAYFKAYQKTYDIVKKHYDTMTKTFTKNRQLNIYGIRFNSKHLEDLYIRFLKEEIATIAHLVNCPLTHAQLTSINSLLMRKSNLEREIKNDQDEATECRALSKKYLDKAAKFNENIISAKKDVVDTNDKIALIVAKARYDEQQNAQEEVDKIDISNAKVDIQLKKIAKEQERKELKELKAIKIAKYKEAQAKLKAEKQEKARLEKQKDLIFKAKIAEEKARQEQVRKDQEYAQRMEQKLAAKKQRAEAKAQVKAEKQRIKAEKKEQKRLALIEKQRLMAQRAAQLEKERQERELQRQILAEQREAERIQREKEAREAEKILQKQKAAQEKKEALARARQEAKEEKARKLREAKEAEQARKAEQERKLQEALEKERKEQEQKAKLAKKKEEAKLKKQKKLAKKKAKHEAKVEKRKQKRLHQQKAAAKKAKAQARKEQLAKAKRQKALAAQEKAEARKQALKEAKAEAKYRKKLKTPIVSRWEKIHQKKLAKEARKEAKANKKGGK